MLISLLQDDEQKVQQEVEQDGETVDGNRTHGQDSDGRQSLEDKRTRQERLRIASKRASRWLRKEPGNSEDCGDQIEGFIALIEEERQANSDLQSELSEKNDKINQMGQLEAENQQLKQSKATHANEMKVLEEKVKELELRLTSKNVTIKDASTAAASTKAFAMQTSSALGMREYFKKRVVHEIPLSMVHRLRRRFKCREVETDRHIDEIRQKDFAISLMKQEVATSKSCPEGQWRVQFLPWMKSNCIKNGYCDYMSEKAFGKFSPGSRGIGSGEEEEEEGAEDLTEEDEDLTEEPLDWNEGVRRW